MKKLVVIQIENGKRKDYETIVGMLREAQKGGALRDFEFIVTQPNVKVAFLEQKILEAAQKLAKEIINEVNKEGEDKYEPDKDAERCISYP